MRKSSREDSGLCHPSRPPAHSLPQTGQHLPQRTTGVCGEHNWLLAVDINLLPSSISSSLLHSVVNTLRSCSDINLLPSPPLHILSVF